MSFLSKKLGLDKHPKLLSVINAVLAAIAASVGIDIKKVEEATSQLGTGNLAEEAIAAAKAAVLELEANGGTVTDDQLRDVIAGVVDHVPHLDEHEKAGLVATIECLAKLWAASRASTT